MQKILRKRVLRDLKSNFFGYFALFMLIVMGMYMVVSVVGAADTIIQNVDTMAEESHLEDGEFTVFVPLTKEQTKELEGKGITLEKMFYLDYFFKDNSTVRIYKNRDKINRIVIDEGRMAENDKEVVIEKRYSQEHNFSVGNCINIGNEKFKIVGIGTVPDYDATLKNMTDSSVDSKNFGLAFVIDEQYKKLREKTEYLKSEEYVYSYGLNGAMKNDELKDSLSELEFKAPKNLTQFIKAEDNPRIKASSKDVIIDKMSGLAAGLIIMVLFTYVISVFVIHNIEKEISVIGTLYALGAKKKELVKHYLTLPVIITLVAGICGVLIGFGKYGIDIQMKEKLQYFSIPKMDNVYPIYLIIYGVVMPPVISILVNYFVISRKLSQPALKMIRNEKKNSGINNVHLGKLSFIKLFQIRQLLREIRTSFTVVFGMFIALLILMLGIDCYVFCHNMSVDNKEDTKYEYMYTYKYPEKQISYNGKECYAETLKKEDYGYKLNVTVLGIDENNPYFNVNTVKGKNKVIVASSTAEKYNLKVGDKLELTDEVNDMDYVFTVKGIAPYSVGLYVFMDIDSMRQLFDQKDDYYNVVLSSENLNIDAKKLYAVTTKEDISKSSDVFISNMMPMISTMIIISMIIFCMVMYLMIKIMIDRSAFSISLIKIFGFRTGEIRKLYLNGNFYVIAVSALICIPAAKKLMDMIYPYLISNVACGMNLVFSWKLYLGIYVGIIICYLVINQLLVRKLKKMVPAEVLKNRE